MREEYEERKIRLLQVTGHKIKAENYDLIKKLEVEKEKNRLDERTDMATVLSVVVKTMSKRGVGSSDFG